MPSLEELKQRRARIDEQIRKEQARIAKKERTARTHALIVMGAMVERQAPGGDWKRVDWDALDAWVKRYGYKIAECEADELPTDEAARRLRDWEARSKPKRPGHARGDGEGGAARPDGPATFDPAGWSSAG